MTKVEEELNTLDDGYSAKDMAVLEVSSLSATSGHVYRLDGPTGLHHLVWRSWTTQSMRPCRVLHPDRCGTAGGRRLPRH